MTLINVIDQDFLIKNDWIPLILYILKDNGQKSINDIIHSKATNNIINPNNILSQKTDSSNDSDNENDYSIYLFQYNKNNIEKERFSIIEEEEKKLNRIFETLFARGQSIDIISQKYSDLQKEIYSIFLNSKIKEYCWKGFTNYTFLNTKKDYDLVKKLLLLFVYYNYNYINMTFGY